MFAIIIKYSMLSIIITPIVETTLFLVRRSYDLGVYLIYGHQETELEKVLKEQEKLLLELKELKQDIHDLNPNVSSNCVSKK